MIARRSGRTALRRWARRHPLRRYEERLAFVGFLGVVVLTGVAMWRWPDQVTRVLMTPWIVLAALFLPVRQLLAVYAVVILFVVSPLTGLVGDNGPNSLALVGLAGLMLVMYVVAVSRARLGIRGLMGEALMVDLRDRLQSGSTIPALPDGWSADYAISSANGETFSGDFLVTALSEDGRILEVVLVDVSGKGEQAGSRSLHLSGAFGGLLGSVPPEGFLQAANHYLLRQRWDEGFATAIHVDIDLVTGRFHIARAGHPPAVVYRSGSGTWTIDRAASGPLLGVVPEPGFVSASSQLGPGDALLIYSDGVVESPGHDLIDGVDRMLGVASRAIVGRRNVADDVVAAARAGLGDDRAAFVIRRG